MRHLSSKDTQIYDYLNDKKWSRTSSEYGRFYTYNSKNIMSHSLHPNKFFIQGVERMFHSQQEAESFTVQKPFITNITISYVYGDKSHVEWIEQDEKGRIEKCFGTTDTHYLRPKGTCVYIINGRITASKHVLITKCVCG